MITQSQNQISLVQVVRILKYSAVVLGAIAIRATSGESQSGSQSSKWKASQTTLCWKMKEKLLGLYRSNKKHTGKFTQCKYHSEELSLSSYLKLKKN